MKRGFTLIEIMAVIVILGVIGLIAVVSVDQTIKSNKEKMYEMQIENIEDAARTWAVDNIKYLPDDDSEAISIPLLVLKQSGIIEPDIKNPKNDTLFYNDMYIDITYKNGIYSYDVVEDSGQSTTNDLDVPVIILKDTFNKTIARNENVLKQGFVMLRNGLIIDFNDGSTYITFSTNLNSNVKGTYYYNITANDGKSFVIKRTITVK